MDIPKDDRRVHDHPIPRMGGLAIIVGFFLAMLLFVPVSEKVYGIVIGAFIIAGMGFVDDIVNLRPIVKLILQLFAAFVCVRFGLVIDAVSWPVTKTYLDLGWWGVPLTMLWIVLCTNAFNLIDGLDGLAAGVTAICSFFLLVGSVLFSTAEPAAAIILMALIGACLGFIPFNFNPAQIFMGDVGSQFLGFILATASILGLFKLQAVAFRPAAGGHRLCGCAATRPRAESLPRRQGPLPPPAARPGAEPEANRAGALRRGGHRRYPEPLDRGARPAGARAVHCGDRAYADLHRDPGLHPQPPPRKGERGTEKDARGGEEKGEVTNCKTIKNIMAPLRGAMIVL